MAKHKKESRPRAQKVYNIEYIIGERPNGEVFVKWDKFKHATWEPIKNVQNTFAYRDWTRRFDLLWALKETEHFSSPEHA